MADINLLSSDQQRPQGVEILRKKLSIVAIIFLVLATVSSLGTLFFYTTLASKRQKLQAEAEGASSKIASLKATEELLVVTKGKVSQAESLLNSRTNQLFILQKMSELVPQNVYFSDFKISQGKITITGRSKSSADMAGFVSQLASSKGTEIVSNVTIESLTSDDTGQYDFSMSGAMAIKKVK